MEKQKNKVIYKTLIEVSPESILIGELAKIMKQNGYEIGQNRLFHWLRENNYLIKIGKRKNLPTQKSMQLQLFEIKQSILQKTNGKIKLVMTPMVTKKGQKYFLYKFKNIIK